ncbi:MAG: hypothetical protein ABI619_11530, partial [Betaproteobacteria bacterium]
GIEPADLDDLSVQDRNVGMAAGRSGSVDDQTVLDQQIASHEPYSCMQTARSVGERDPARMIACSRENAPTAATVNRIGRAGTVPARPAWRCRPPPSGFSAKRHRRSASPQAAVVISNETYHQSRRDLIIMAITSLSICSRCDEYLGLALFLLRLRNQAAHA